MGPLTKYVVAVACVIAVLVVVIYVLRGKEPAVKYGTFALGFLLGMLAMYLKVYLVSGK